MIRRILIAILCTLSAIMAMQWARSLRRCDSISVLWTVGLHDGKDHSHAEPPSDLLLPGRLLSLYSSIGTLYVSFDSQRGLSLLDGHDGNLIYADWRWDFKLNRPSRATAPYRWFAYSFESPQGLAGWSLEVPWWFLTALPTLPACLLLRRELRDRTLAKSRRSSLCPTCGYDLRASKDRCPECGSPIPLQDATGAKEKPGDCA